MKKILLIIVSLMLLTGINKAQQGLTLYNMDRVLQSQWINPSADLEYNIHIGGLIVPVFGQLPPSMYFNYANNSFYYNHLLHMGEGDKSDKLVLDVPLFMSRLRNTTHMRFDNHFELINFGIKLEDFMLTFAVTEKLKYGLSLPYDMFEFIFNGNRPYMLEDKPLDFSNLNFNFTHYREFALGFSTDINEKLSIGGRAKILFGQSNFNTDISTLTLYTNPENYHMTFSTDMAIRASMPFYFDYEVHDDSISFDINQASIDDIDPMNYLTNMNNFGMALDIGASYKLTPDIDLFASVVDLGMISWNTNPQSFISKGDFLFRGVQMQMQMFEEEDGFEESMEEFADSILNTFLFDLQEGSYVTFLPSSIYLGGMYKFHEKLHFGALYRLELYQRTPMQSISVSVNSNLTHWFTAHASYSIMNNYFGNLGLGFSARLGFVNWFVVTDNLFGMIYPQKLNNLNIRMGCNLVFGQRIRSAASFM